MIYISDKQNHKMNYIMYKYSSVIIGSGSYLPKHILTNEELAKTVDTNDEWIVSRTGITQRHIVAENETTSDMAYQAAKNAINAAAININEIDMIIVCTTTPDCTFPSVAVQVQAKLGLKNIPAFDLQAVCSGFIYGLTTADSFIKTANAKTILLIGADAMSKLVDWSDRGTCILFGDGAGAVVIKAHDSEQYQGIISSSICADGAYESILVTNGGTSSTQTTGSATMVGKEVFKHAVEKMSSSVTELLDKTGYTKDDINWLIPHQANLRILDAVAKKLDFPKDKVAMTLDKQANTSAATIPLALDHYVKAGMIKSGDLIMTTALGAGLTWGACLFRWK
jgi:3-oxoacyl-[acyl-carrier-protein] synthase III